MKGIPQSCKCQQIGCGKTYFVKSVLKNCNHVMDIVPENIVRIYTSFHQPMYNELKKMNKKIQLVEGLPYSFEDIKLSSQSKSPGHPQRCHYQLRIIWRLKFLHNTDIRMSVMMLTQNGEI